VVSKEPRNEEGSFGMRPKLRLQRGRSGERVACKGGSSPPPPTHTPLAVNSNLDKCHCRCTKHLLPAKILRVTVTALLEAGLENGVSRKNRAGFLDKRSAVVRGNARKASRRGKSSAGDTIPHTLTMLIDD